MTRKPPTNSLIAVVGATGTGKSELAVQLAKRFNGEIINGDAMQLYAGLPIITNKITLEEQQGVQHHLLGCVGWHEPTWVVGTFVNKALKVIEEIRSRGKLPILVGGTHYYTQSLLFHDRLTAEGEEKEPHDAAEEPRQQWPILDQPTEVLLEELKKVDRAMADRWHPKDRRKIARSLEIYLKTGCKASEIYAEQRARKANATKDQDGEWPETDGAPMRFPTLLFWVHAETEALRPRLDKRVDKMLEAGLLDEVRTLNAQAHAEVTAGREVDETRGIWVSIGYKEFKDYDQALARGEIEKRELDQMQSNALEKTKAATRQYAKRQVRWIRIKLIHALAETRALSNIYLLDSSITSNFSISVVEPATELTSLFLQSAPMPLPSSLSALAAAQLQPKREFDHSARPENWTKQHCDVCNVTCVIAEQWEQHITSKAHRKLVSKRKQQATRRADELSHASCDSSAMQSGRSSTHG